jgi:hypothetical protein
VNSFLSNEGSGRNQGGLRRRNEGTRTKRSSVPRASDGPVSRIGTGQRLTILRAAGSAVPAELIVVAAATIHHAAIRLSTACGGRR